VLMSSLVLIRTRCEAGATKFTTPNH
jgi:hypothetical protein